MNNSVIQITNLSRSFGENKAVDNLSLEVNTGEIFGFLGHNGAGKTTTVRLLNGIYSPTSGGSRVLGIDPQVDGPALRAKTGVLTETPSLDERLSGYENLAYYAELFALPQEEIKARINDLLSEFGLEKQANDKVGTYSKGMKQSLALARALIHKPKVLFLDEPTSSLDPVAARHVTDMIERLTRREGCTVFLCTHNLVEAQKLCDRVAVMQHGQLKALGTPAELTQQYIKRLNIELEVSEPHIEKTIDILLANPRLVLNPPVIEKNLLVVTVSGRDAIPEILSLLTSKDISVYRLNPQEVNLEEVYFALNGESK